MEKLDPDIRRMSFGERGRELQKLRRLIRAHKRATGNARCWCNDRNLYEESLPEGHRGIGTMVGFPIEALLRNCRRYIVRQQCRANGRCPSRSK